MVARDVRDVEVAGSNPVCPMKKAFCNQRAFFYGLRLFRHSSLFWGDATDFFVGADEVAGVGEAGFLADVVEGFVGVEKEIVGFADSDKLNVFLASAAKMSFELFGKV